jgi:SPX domain protein involved in polyphosphate accumulation
MSPQPEELRYERKFLIEAYSAAEVQQIIKFHPACFSEIYHERIVNNIYFDDPGFKSYFDNIDGNTLREKVRIRWYNGLFGMVSSPVLEFKIKKGLMGYKDSFRLPAFEMNEKISKDTLTKLFASAGIPQRLLHKLNVMQPVLLNSYRRKYYISADKKFRLTVDSDLCFYRMSSVDNHFLNKQRMNVVVMELKYDMAHEAEAKEVGTDFPFAMTKNSKYLQGIERVVF